MDKKQEPFRQLGERLKTIRQRLQESVSDVSGAVEIDEVTLERIERGLERPSEDILMLLITHFGMREDEATGLWHLAGYVPDRQHDIDTNPEELVSGKGGTAILVVAPDPRVMYSDGVQVQANKHGVVISFTQNIGVISPLTTTRVGMSREQAANVIQALQDALNHSDRPLQLPEGTQAKREDQRKRK